MVFTRNTSEQQALYVSAVLRSLK